MRLLDVETLEFQDFNGAIPPYAIASHHWLDSEATYHEVRDGLKQESTGFRKVKGFCDAVKKLQAAGEIKWLWMDTCCTNKADFTEFSEAINSMFRWYAEASICIAYLSDVDSLDSSPEWVMRQFWRSEWFTRGWTLQELLAPKLVLFLNRDWEPLGHKAPRAGLWDVEALKLSTRLLGFNLSAHISKITEIPERVLFDVRKSNDYSIEDRKAWMEGRTTTKPEDLAYCQFGLFGIFLPLIYGERENAMERLEEELQRKKTRLQPIEIQLSAQSPKSPKALKPPTPETPLDRRRSTKFVRGEAPYKRTITIDDRVGSRTFETTVDLRFTIGQFKLLLAKEDWIGRPWSEFGLSFFDKDGKRIPLISPAPQCYETKLKELNGLYKVTVKTVE
ncbi:Hypothetical predicted protein [Lecanosticta acicola]|uniref:Heterokaryon incompatibility domain-containing protein n=1 Tax=Lecanosticta acicola TaxID=111012 RepID=A0AAI8YVB6_9PEZI|nr:Hypothetical predicted protein [Lecanosticta acicola]